jgi:hypothetical protein
MLSRAGRKTTIVFLLSLATTATTFLAVGGMVRWREAVVRAQATG